MSSLNIQQFGICKLSVTPVRKAAKDTEEQTNQIIFGDQVLVLDREKQWVFVKTLHDNYTGWADHAAFMWFEHQQSDSRAYISSKIAHVRSAVFDQPVLLSLGTSIRNEQLISGQSSQIGHPHPVNECIHFARKFLGTPYLWGGRTSFGIDCSGLTQIVYKLIGHSLPRDAWQQAEQLTTISLTDAQVGDLIFFTTRDDDRVTHVGIKSGEKTIIHAHKYVREDKLHSSGIFQEETREITHRYLHAGRITSP